MHQYDLLPIHLNAAPRPRPRLKVFYNIVEDDVRLRDVEYESTVEVAVNAEGNT